MPNRAKVYVGTVIAAGASLLLANLPQLAPSNWFIFLLAVTLACALSPLKLRLPGMEGTYAPTFVPVLYGIARLSLPETLVIGLVIALVQSYINAKHRPTPVQVAFNAANLALSIGVCFFVQGLLSGVNLAASAPVVSVLIAGLYFVVNTGVVSGVLVLLMGKPLADVTASWYVWSFPYYLAGAAAVNLATAGSGEMYWGRVIVLVAVLGLLHFYCGLAERVPRDPLPDRPDMALPAEARLYLIAVLAAAAVVLVACALSTESVDPARLAALLGLTAVTSALKVRLPGLESSVSLGFVVLLSAVTEQSFSELTLLAAVASLVQSLWRPVHRPKPVQIAFNVACLALAATLAFAVVRVALASAVGSSLVAQLGLATVFLYGANTFLVSAMLCLVERQALGVIWRRSHFWVFPYYLVGAATAALLVSTSRTNGWVPALLVLPTMLLVYVSYRVQVNRHTVQAG